MPPPTPQVSSTVLRSPPLRLEQSRQWLLWLGAAATIGFAANPAWALLAGIGFALSLGNAHRKQTGRVAKYLLQASVVGLGFGVKPAVILSAGLTGLGATAVSLILTLAVGWALARWLQIDAVTGALISAGTAICGGSAIAVMGPILGAEDRQMSISLLVVFFLNAVALFVFPVIGSWTGLDQNAFGWWAAMAIHDTSSVAGAAAHYGATALGVAIAVKLARALWILPLAAGTALIVRRPGTNCLPWFVLGFLAASAAGSFSPLVASIAPTLTLTAKAGLAVTLFLLGTGLSRDALRNTGWRPFVHAIILWVFVAVTSFAAVRWLNFAP